MHTSQLTEIIRDLWLQLDHSRNFKGIQSMVKPRLKGCNIENRGIEENYCSKLKKKKSLKLKSYQKYNIR